MKKKASYILVLLMAAACSVQEPLQQPQKERVNPAGIAPGTLIVEFDDTIVSAIEGGEKIETKGEQISNVLEGLDVISMERVFPHAGEFEERTRREGLHRFYTVIFDQSKPVTKAAADLTGLPGIISVEPAREVAPRAFTDPYYGYQWHYENSSRDNADINVKTVWDNYTTGRDNVVVCVVDEPVDPTHEDLQANLWKDSSGHTGYNFARSSYDLTIRPERGQGDVGHGTHVAGTISAVNNNGLGLCGVAGGDASQGIKGVRIQSCAIFSGNSYASDAQTANAIKWGADHEAVISQNSWGYYADTNQDGRISNSELTAFKKETIPNALRNAIDYFIKYAGCDNSGNQLPDSPMKGGLVFFAAGNEDIDYDPICAYEPVNAVGAFRETGGKASYSNYGAWVDIAAPGGEGTSSANSIWSTLPKNNYISNSGYGGSSWAGTSMACPHASGVAALIVSYYGGQGFTNEKAKEILYAGLGGTIGGGSPIGKKLDAAASFEYGGVVGVDPLVLSTTERTVHAHETASVTLTVKSTDKNATVECDPGSEYLSFDQNTGEITIRGRNEKEASYTATFTLKSSREDYSVELHYTLLPNHAPAPLRNYPDIILDNNYAIKKVSVPSDLANLFQDPDGEVPAVKFSSSSEGVVYLVKSGASLALVPGGEYGYSTVSITATDSFGEEAVISFMVFIKDESKAGESEIYPSAGTDTVGFWPGSPEVENYHVEIFSESGSLVKSFDCSGSVTSPLDMDIKDLAPGVYTAVVSDSQGNKTEVKFVKY